MVIRASKNRPIGRTMRVGFVPLIDAAPIIVAQTHGLFEEEGIHAILERQLGWGNVRDKLAFGHLDASHALLGQPLDSELGTGAGGEPFCTVMALGTGGDAITLSKRLIRTGVKSAVTLSEYLKQHSSIKPVFGHVFRSSVHHYLLRQWLSSAGINPDQDMRLCVLPPSQMAGHLGNGNLDGYCVGEPWNMLARVEQQGDIVALTTDIVPAHPDKVLAVRRSLIESNDDLCVRMIRAILRACAFCEDTSNRAQLASLLGASDYLNMDSGVINASLEIGRLFQTRSTRLPSWSMRSFSSTSTTPDIKHAVWIMNEMRRWGHISDQHDISAIAIKCTHHTAYDAALASIDLPIHKTDQTIPI